jgi:flavin reductase (DIM6/NTAB) family NADH-FMN oxidoreductase RutF
MFATGVTVITTLKGEQVHGMTANAFMSVSMEPPLVLISVDRSTKMCGMLHEGSHYGVSVLCESQAKLSDRFAGRPCDDCPNPQFQLVRETPLVEGALAHFVARVESPTGAATTRSSWAAWNTRAKGPAPRCCSTAGATSGWARRLRPGRAAR